MLYINMDLLRTLLILNLFGFHAGIPGSYCHGSVIEGIYQGYIHLPDEVFYVEKSNRFLNVDPSFHSVIYREKDQLRRKSSSDHNEIMDMASRQHSNQSNLLDRNHRNKRSTQSSWTKNTCTLYLETDTTLWNHYYYHKSGEDAGVTHQDILATLASHVHAVNRIFQTTTFQTYDGSLKYQGVQLAIKRIKVNANVHNCDAWFCQGPEIRDGNILLHLFNKQNFDEFCLAYAFTFRDFQEGSIGLAFQASPSDKPREGQGICATIIQYTENQKIVLRSRNTGIITIKNYLNEVSPKVSHLNFAHQLGHSFGSPHDSGGLCEPGDTGNSFLNGDNYIMSRRYIDGDWPNNYHFSPCSRDNITRVLNSTYKTCLVEKEPICGNYQPEEGEECDCGYPDECDDDCCNPVTCKVNKSGGNVCSPSQGPCCSSTCEYLSEGHICMESDCSLTSYCSGLTADCPTENKEDGTYCASFSATCRNGACVGSLCERFGWSQCFISEAIGNSKQQCMLACEKNGTCIASYADEVENYPDYKQMLDELEELTDRTVTIDGIGLEIGAFCNNYRGRCDSFGVCLSN